MARIKEPLIGAVVYRKASRCRFASYPKSTWFHSRHSRLYLKGSFFLLNRRAPIIQLHVTGLTTSLDRGTRILSPCHFHRMRDRTSTEDLVLKLQQISRLFQLRKLDRMQAAETHDTTATFPTYLPPNRLKNNNKNVVMPPGRVIFKQTRRMGVARCEAPPTAQFFRVYYY